MYSQHNHQQQQHQHYQQVMDNTNYLPTPNSMHNYNPNQPQRHSQLPPPPPPPHHHHQHHYNQAYIVPPEPVPSATDAQPTPLLSISQLADFASTMVYLMWHARRPSVMALHEQSKIISNTHTDDRNLGHSRETANIANRTSSAFKKFCKQVSK
jgi:hypothetical protein